MRYIYMPSQDPSVFARSLQLDEKRKFQWNSTGGMDVLLVQTPYGKHPTDEDHPYSMDKLCTFLNGSSVELKNGTFVYVMRDVWMMYLTQTEILQRAAVLRTEASSYTVFCCRREEDTITVYAHSDINWTTAPYMDIPLDFEYSITPVNNLRRKFLVLKQEEFSGYYMLSLPKKLSGNYEDGSICCKVTKGARSFIMPVTRAMLEQGVVYIETGEEFIRPEIAAANDGFKLKRRN